MPVPVARSLARLSPRCQSSRRRGGCSPESAGVRALRFTHTHTGERLAIEYFSGGTYVPDALSTVNHFLRDFRTGDIHEIDPALLDLLHGLATVTETSRPFQVISGYRSPATNEMLRHRSEGVAAGSLHMKGQAIDIRLARRAARQAAAGGARRAARRRRLLPGIRFRPRRHWPCADVVGSQSRHRVTEPAAASRARDRACASWR